MSPCSLEMEEERVYNEMSSFHNVAGGSAAAAVGAVHAASVHRTRTVSSPVPVNVSIYKFCFAGTKNIFWKYYSFIAL